MLVVGGKDPTGLIYKPGEIHELSRHDLREGLCIVDILLGKNASANSKFRDLSSLLHAPLEQMREMLDKMALNDRFTFINYGDDRTEEQKMNDEEIERLSKAWDDAYNNFFNADHSGRDPYPGYGPPDLSDRYKHFCAMKHHAIVKGLYNDPAPNTNLIFEDDVRISLCGDLYDEVDCGVPYTKPPHVARANHMHMIMLWKVLWSRRKRKHRKHRSKAVGAPVRKTIGILGEPRRYIHRWKVRRRRRKYADTSPNFVVPRAAVRLKRLTLQYAPLNVSDAVRWLLDILEPP